jgi:hypothetical protein
MPAMTAPDSETRAKRHAPIVFTGNVFAVIDDGRALPEEYVAAEKLILAETLSYPGGLGCIVVIPAGAKPPPEAQRKAIDGVLTRLSTHPREAAQVGGRGRRLRRGGGARGPDRAVSLRAALVPDARVHLGARRAGMARDAPRHLVGHEDDRARRRPDRDDEVRVPRAPDLTGNAGQLLPPGSFRSASSLRSTQPERRTRATSSRIARYPYAV